MIPTILGLIILGIIAYVAIKVLGDLLKGLLLIACVFLVSVFLLGTLPDLSTLPLVGKYLPPTGKFTQSIRGFFYSLNLLSTSKTASGNLLILVANTGKLPLSNFSVELDGKRVKILNNPKDPLNAGEATAIEVDWKGSYENLTVYTKKATANLS